MEILDLVLFLIIFLCVLWLQNNDDKKFNKDKRKHIFDKIKTPLFVALIVLLIKNYNCDIYSFFKKMFNNEQKIFLDNNLGLGLLTENTNRISDVNNLLELNNTNAVSDINSLFGLNNTSNIFNDIFIDPPDF